MLFVFGCFKQHFPDFIWDAVWTRGLVCLKFLKSLSEFLHTERAGWDLLADRMEGLPLGWLLGLVGYVPLVVRIVGGLHLC